MQHYIIDLCFSLSRFLTIYKTWLKIQIRISNITRDFIEVCEWQQITVESQTRAEKSRILLAYVLLYDTVKKNQKSFQKKSFFLWYCTYFCAVKKGKLHSFHYDFTYVWLYKVNILIVQFLYTINTKAKKRRTTNEKLCDKEYKYYEIIPIRIVQMLAAYY